jgi:hypothetical protein
LAQAIASILESKEEQTELLRLLVNNSTHGGNGPRNAHGQAPSTYGEFLGTHPPSFAKAGEPLEANHYLYTIESKFGQLLGNASVWWANYTIAHPTDYQVSWAKFCEAFRAHHIPAGITKRKHQEFMDLKQGRRFVPDYSKLFNHLAQYALEQVDTNEKKKYHFMNGLSTKLQERLARNTGGTFLELVSNAIIMDDVISAHNEGKKRKIMVASSSSAPSKYHVVYVPHQAHLHHP